METRKYDERGRDKIIGFLGDCKKIADLGCNRQKIREDAVGYDFDVKVNPDVLYNLNKGINCADETYDGICISHFLEHVIDCRKFLKNCLYALKDDGRIAIVVPDGETVPSKTLGDSSNTHEMLFTPKTLKLYLENTGFKDVVTEYYDRPDAYKQTKGIFAKGVK